MPLEASNNMKMIARHFKACNKMQEHPVSSIQTLRRPPTSRGDKLITIQLPITRPSLETGNVQSARWPVIEHNLPVAITWLRISQEPGNSRHTDSDERQQLERMMFSVVPYVGHGTEN